MFFENSFYEITMVLLFSALLGIVAFKLKQPLIIAFIFVGIFVGPSGFSLIKGHAQIELFAEMGIAILLFIVGLKLDISMIKSMGLVSLATGLGQVLFTSIFGYLIAIALGMDLIEAIYVSMALTFSSTIIIVKLLSDKKEIDSLHGRIAVGLLIVQDIVVIIAMIGLSAAAPKIGSDEMLFHKILLVLGKGALFLFAIVILMKYVLPKLLKNLAHSQELIALFSITWAIFLAATSDFLGFNKEVGAFLAGISIASTAYREAIGARLVSLRDFLLLFFFISLGSRLDLSVLSGQLFKASIFSTFVLIGNPFIVMIIMSILGYRKRTGFLTGLTVAQISEFSLILASLGLALGHINRETMGLIVLVGIMTIGISTYMILYSSFLYNHLAPFLSFFERKNPYREISTTKIKRTQTYEAIIFGLGSYGGNIASNLMLRNKNIIGVDFDPEILEKWSSCGFPVIYGDATDPQILDNLPIKKTKWIIGCIYSRDSNLTLLNVIKHYKYKGKIALTARSQEDADAFKSYGSDIVFRPFADAADQAVDSLSAPTHAISGSLIKEKTLKEIRLKPGSVFSGKTISQIPLRPETGVSIIAITRAGKNFFDPPIDFRLYPGDRVVMLGEEDNLKKASIFLDKREFGEEHDEFGFRTSSLEVPNNSDWIGKTLHKLNFRTSYGVTIIAVERENRQITAPSASEIIQENDRLIVAGDHEAIEKLENTIKAEN